MSTDDREETLAGRYRLGATLGKGAMGFVREATDTETGRSVAVKVILPELAEDAVAIERFRREAVAAGALDHPGIVRVLDSSDDPPFLVMELVRGSALPRGPLAPERAVAITTKLLEALEVAHAAGIVHRDLKPSNVLTVPSESGGEQPKILDFGVAKLVESPTWQKLTRSGERVGTPAYAAPEQMGDGDVDGRADLYAVGLLLFRMLSGQAPPRTSLAAAIRGTSPRPADPREHVPTLDPRLAAVVLRATAADRDERWPSAPAMREALAPFLAPRRRRGLPTWGVALGIGLVVALAIAIWPREGEAAPPPRPTRPRVEAPAPEVVRPPPRVSPPAPPEAPPSLPAVGDPGAPLGGVVAGDCRALEAAVCECPDPSFVEARCASTRAEIRAWMTSRDHRAAEAECARRLLGAAAACPYP